ncbi:four-carbon acid sugar kinase family protein [Devosia beringensis]|uniref:four-carbon acid sugar kinase family protein n=1 Tax=Devosia beringensis TaxID=2657486 RepID=UPI00186B5929|nr:four-carbon acid sugar kinase family protein [Devosia beringensis]
MTRLGVVADDLTGALDAAAPFAARGIATVVALGPEGLVAALASGADVVGVSSNSREASPDDAGRAVAQCLENLPAGLPLFKKVDSRLKGNIAAELDAIPFNRALVVPAIPAFDRWVRDGRLGGFGVDQPIDIAARLGRHAGKASIPDIVTQADIEQALETGGHDLLVGARGLAEALAVQWAPEAVALVPPLGAPVYCVIGSTDAITLTQVARLRDACPGLTHIAAPDGQMPEGASSTARLTVLQATAGETRADGATVAQRLGEGLQRLQPPRGAVLVISGGATAQVVLGALGITVLRLDGEALPGLPLAHAGGFTIITKSGGFGDADTLLTLLGHLGGPGLESDG